MGKYAFGSGSLVKTGAGRLTLGGDNSYSAIPASPTALIAANVSAGRQYRQRRCADCWMPTAHLTASIATLTYRRHGRTGGGQHPDAGQLTREDGSTLKVLTSARHRRRRGAAFSTASRRAAL
ncbi:autotransporter-associated beta strand repeat-containing protein [Salmonella enterica subsp. enterica]|nr:autotransporter-associated beta strand repeat-containing protein [Salmonella enterica subsp. enterica]